MIALIACSITSEWTEGKDESFTINAEKNTNKMKETWKKNDE